MKRLLMLSLLTSTCYISGYAVDKVSDFSANRNSIENVLQNKTIKGIVKDANGEPVIGANVSVKGTATGAITDIDGNFNFNSPAKGTLVISFIGYTTQEIPVGSKNEYISVLKEDTALLDEVVVTG